MKLQLAIAIIDFSSIQSSLKFMKKPSCPWPVHALTNPEIFNKLLAHGFTDITVSEF